MIDENSRIRIRIRFRIPDAWIYHVNYDLIQTLLLAVSVESETLDGEEGTLVLLMDPGQYRLLEDTVKTETQVTGAFRVVRGQIMLDHPS